MQGRTDIDRRFRRFRIQEVVTMTVVYAIFYVCRLAFSAAKKDMIEQGAYTTEEIGWVGSSMLVAYAVGKCVNGFIADRFSKIGSLPEPVDTQLREMLSHVVEYMDRRTSQKVVIRDAFSSCEAHVMVNGSLFEWVLENLCKNAIDAQPTRIEIRLSEDGVIEVEDNGKGIAKNQQKKIFQPGCIQYRKIT